jgi:hypothetical protein
MNNVGGSGMLVLFDKGIEQADLNRFDPIQLSRLIGYGDHLNGCSSLQFVKGYISYAVIERTGGLVSWSRHEDRVRIDLVHGIDSGYFIEASYHAGRLHGVGTSWGAGVAHPDFGPDVVIARRVGEARIDRCFRDRRPS